MPRRDADLARAAFSVHEEVVPPRTPR
jgi:hypothetical protein